jgi:hypothetical protein
MAIGDSFPLEKRKAYVERNLKAWSVIYLYCESISPPHDKFLLIVSASPYVLYFFINTEPYELAKSNPKMKETQVPIDVKEHPFLSYDSFIDCSRLLSLPTYEVERQLVADVGRVKGVISDAIQAKVLEAVRKNRVMSPRKKKMILEQLLSKTPRRGGRA